MLSPREPLRPRRLLPLAAGIIAFFAIADAGANTFVYNCEDHGQGSLRYAVSVAPEGDVVDMRGLTCSKITLTTGAIQVAQQDLYFFGPGQDQLTITGKYGIETVEQDRIFNHTGSGTLDLQEMTISYGAIDKQAKGGCIYSAGSVTLGGVTVTNCFIGNSYGKGGGVFANHSLELIFATLSFNDINAPSTVATAAAGGGAYANGDLLMTESTIDSNVIGGAGCIYRQCFGGGLANLGNAKIYYSTISHNSASFAGGMGVVNPYSGSDVVLHQTTISGNTATAAVAGMYINAQTIDLQASTVAFNIAHDSFQGVAYYASGLSIGSSRAPAAVSMNDMLISNNAYNFAIESDFGALPLQTVTITGSNNFVRESLSSVPSGTISNVCPWLGPLRDNGGPTKTHALLSHSPAIDAGKNESVLQYDQRVYTFSRVSGASEDIGAYEVQQGDIIFNDSFNPCN
jgi:hypothetical protein